MAQHPHARPCQSVVQAFGWPTLLIARARAWGGGGEVLTPAHQQEQTHAQIQTQEQRHPSGPHLQVSEHGKVQPHRDAPRKPRLHDAGGASGANPCPITLSMDRTRKKIKKVCVSETPRKIGVFVQITQSHAKKIERCRPRSRNLWYAVPVPAMGRQRSAIARCDRVRLGAVRHSKYCGV